MYPEQGQEIPGDSGQDEGEERWATCGLGESGGNDRYMEEPDEKICYDSGELFGWPEGWAEELNGLLREHDDWLRARRLLEAGAWKQNERFFWLLALRFLKDTNCLLILHSHARVMNYSILLFFSILIVILNNMMKWIGTIYSGTMKIPG